MKVCKFIYHHRKYLESLLGIIVILWLLLCGTRLVTFTDFLLLGSFFIIFSLLLSYIVCIFLQAYKQGIYVFTATVLAAIMSSECIYFLFIRGASSSSKSTENLFFQFSILYLIVLMIPFSLLLYNDTRKIVTKYKKAFDVIHRNDVDIYGVPVIELISFMGIMFTLASSVFLELNRLSLIIVSTLIYTIPVFGLVAITEQMEYRISNRIKNYKDCNISWIIQPHTSGVGCGNSDNPIGCIISKSYYPLMIHIKSLCVNQNNINKLSFKRVYKLKHRGSNQTLITNEELHRLLYFINTGICCCNLTLVDNHHQSHSIKFEYKYEKYVKDSHVRKFVK